MTNYLNIINSPQIKHDKYFEVLRDFRKGGINLENFEEIIKLISKLPDIAERKPSDFALFDKFGLSDISENDQIVITRELQRRSIESNKKCWHPEASLETCRINSSGKIIISAAHSIQNNGILSRIVENGHVMGYTLDKAEFEGKEYGKNHASIFWGFCNIHDSIFNPIEISPYKGTEEQHFLFAYRGFVISSHKKEESTYWIDYGEQSINDIKKNKKLFDSAILSKEYSVIKTEVFELPAMYPIAVSSSFYLDFDFNGNAINHSEDRMEDIYVTLFPTNNKTYFLISYFKQDANLYSDLGNQLRKRNKLKSDITMLVAAHTENVYFNPIYYKTFIEKHEEELERISFQSQFDYASVGKDNEISIEFSFTPNDYLNNSFGINFFGY
ncbi:MAG: hypothetical protein KAS71_10010 [Bacteroidales bacterium]|nr:hypothetical protein [Bacteroidales bacterium]